MADVTNQALTPAATLRLCYVHCYREPNYIRKLAQLDALRLAPGIDTRVACNRRRGALRYLEALLAVVRATRQFRPDVYLLGFRGHEIFWLLRLLAHGRPVVIDALMSPSIALVEERRGGTFGILLGRLLLPLEGRILRRADLVLTDTTAHAELYAQRFGVAPERILPIPVGAIPEPDQISNRKRPAGAPLRVLFYGSFLPLHGVDVIIEAAAMLHDRPIQFDFIGGSLLDMHWLRKRCAILGVQRYTHRRWVPFDVLVQRDIADADVCLGGPFGATPQAMRVVTSKTSQCLAQGKPTVVGKTPLDAGFIDRENCLLVNQRDPVALAAVLRWCDANRDRLPDIGDAGATLYRQRLSVEAISEPLAAALQRLVPDRT